MQKIHSILVALIVVAFASPALAQGKGKDKKEDEPPGNAKAEKARKKGEKNADRGKANSKKAKKGKEAAEGKRKGPPSAEEARERGRGVDGMKHRGKGMKMKEKGGPKGKGKGNTGALAKENEKHLKRLAKINRIEEIAKKNGNDKLLSTAKMLRQKEAKRHSRAMQRVKKGNLGRGKGAEKERPARGKKGAWKKKED